MVALILAAGAAFVWWLTVSHGPVVQFFLNMLAGLAVNRVAIPAVHAYSYARRMLMRAAIFVGAYLGLFLFFVGIGWQWAAMAMAIVATLVLFGFAYICYQLQRPLGSAAKRIEGWAQRALAKDVIIEVKLPGQDASAFKKAAAAVINLAMLVVNIPYAFLLGFPRRLLAGLAANAASLAETAEHVVRYLSRMGMVIGSYAMTITLFLLLGMITGKQFLTLAVIGVFGLLLTVILQVAVLKDWKFPFKGIPILAAPSIAVNFALLLVIALAVVDPRPAQAIGNTIDNVHTFVVKGFESLSLFTSGPSQRWFRVTRPIKRTYIKNSSGGFDVAKNDQPVSPGRVGILIGNSDTSGPVPLVQVAFQDKKVDPDMVNYQSDEGKLAWRWVPADAVQEISGKPADAGNAADYGPEVPEGWKAVSTGQVDVKEQSTSVGQVSGKVLIQIWGSAVIDSTHGSSGPDGWIGKRAPEFFPLPDANLFAAIAYADGKVLLVGSSKEFNFPAGTNLSLGPNDEAGQDGLGFKDNSGSWQYRICVPE
jgi:hypothetical protein